MTLTEFLLARIAADEAPTWELVPYDCPPGCCAPEGWVGHRCLVCDETSFGGASEAIAETAREHDEQVHRRSRVLAECEAKRRIVDWAVPVVNGVRYENEDGRDLLRLLALPYVDHPECREEWKP